MLQYFEVPSIDATVRKNMIDGIVERVLLDTGVKKSELLYLDDELNTSRQPGTQIGDVPNFSYGQGERTTVEVTEEPDEMERIARGVGLNRQVPFFHDNTYNISLEPIMRRYDVEATITRNSISKDRLQRWCNRLNSLIDMGQYSLITEAEFYYLVPTEAMALLRDCHSTIKVRDPDFKDLGTFLKDGFKANVTKITNVAGEKASLAVRHTPTRIEVVYDISGPTREKQELGYNASVRIQFSYEKPVEVRAKHPLVLNQTLLNSKWVPTPQPPYLSNEVGVVKSDIQHALDSVANYYYNTLTLPWLLTGEESYSDLHIPDRDAITTIIGSDVIFDSGNMERPDVVGLEDFPFTIHPDILEYIKACYCIDRTGRNCVFRLRFFKDRIPLSDDVGGWDCEGYWTYDGNIVLSSNYYYIFYFINNWRYLDLPMQKMLRQYPKALKIIYEWWRKNKILDIDTTRPVTWDVLEQVAKDMSRPAGIGILEPITVFNTTIITFRPGNEYANT